MKGGKIIAAIMVIVIIAGIGYYGYHYETTGKLKVNTDDIMVSNATNSPDASHGSVHGGMYITFSAIALHKKGASNSTGWTNYSLHDKTVNVLDLTSSNASFLSNLSVHAGTYNMIKIYIKSISVNMSAPGITSNTTLTLSAPFALAVHTITVSAHGTTSIVIDIHERGIISSSSKFMMSGNMTILS